MVEAQMTRDQNDDPRKLSAMIARVSELAESHAVSWAIEYGNTDYVPLLSRIWPVPDDLPHAAGIGEFDTQDADLRFAGVR